MDISTTEVPIPNLADYNMLLLDEEDWSVSDRKYMPLANGEDDVHLPNTCVHTVLSKPREV